MEDQLGIGNATTLASDGVVEDERLIDWDQHIEQEVVSALLNFFFDHRSPTHIDNAIDPSIGLGSSLHVTEVHAFYDAWISIQEGALAEIFEQGHYLPSKGTVGVRGVCGHGSGGSVGQLAFFGLGSRGSGCSVSLGLHKFYILNDEDRS